MKRTLLLSVFMLSLFFTTSLFAQTGKIKGVITDKTTGEPLFSVNLILIGTSYGAATNFNGEYEILQVPEGTYDLKVSYIGYEAQVLKGINISSGRTTIINLELSSESVEMDEVVVQAQAAGQIDAVNQQLSSESIVNVVSSARIQELPDANAAESIGRLPGVSVKRVGGEGNKVVIRGLSPKYNAINVNGVRMSATGSGDRSTDLSMISPYMLEGIEVTKAITSDKDADAIGGSVDFQIKTAPDKGFNMNVVAQGGYATQRETFNNYKFVLGVSDRFLDKKLGVFAQVDIENRDRSSDEFGSSYRIDNPTLTAPNQVLLNNLNLKDITRNKKRYGGTLVLDYLLSKGSINLTSFVSSVDNTNTNRTEKYDSQNNAHNYTSGDYGNTLSVFVNSLKFEYDFNGLMTDVLVSYSWSENDTPFNLTYNFIENAAFNNIIDTPDPQQIINEAKNNLDNTFLDRVSTASSYNRENEFTAALNFKFNWNFSKTINSVIKFGGKYRYKNRDYNRDEYFMPIAWGGRQAERDAILEAFPWMQKYAPLGSLHLPYAIFIDHGYKNENFLDGNYQLGPTGTFALMHDVYNILDPMMWTHYPNTKMNDYFGNETYGAGYVMAKFNFWKNLSITPGVRYESNKTVYTAYRGDQTQAKDNEGYQYIDTTTTRNNGFWLPMLLVKYSATDWFDIRAAYTNTLSRPNYNRIIPSWNITENAVNWSNYKLDPSHSTNYDLYFVLHGNKLGLISVGGFYKKIEDLIFYTGNRVILDPTDYELPTKEKGKRIRTYINNDYDVDMWGIEFETQTNFWFLPEPFDGFVVNLNYTHIFSEAKYPKTEIKTEYINQYPYVIQTNIDTFYTNRLIDQPDDIVNVSLGYDYKGFSARLSFLYQTNIFTGNNFYPELRSYTDDYIRWDFTVNQKLPISGLQIFLNYANISGAIDRSLNYGSSFPTKEQYYGATIDLGLRYRL